MLHIQLQIKDNGEKAKIMNWIHEVYPNRFLFEEAKTNKKPNVFIMEIENLFDWVKIHRYKKNNKDCIIFPLLSKEWIHTSPIAVELKLQSMFIKPLKRNSFIRTIRKVVKDVNCQESNYSDIYKEIEEQKSLHGFNVPFQEAFLRRLLRGEIYNEQEVVQARSFLTDIEIPNCVVFIQGFVCDPDREKVEGWQATSIIQRTFQVHFTKLVGSTSYISFRRHLLMLLRVPGVHTHFQDWVDGENALLQIIHVLKEEYGIQLYIGVGSIYQDSLKLHLSYREAIKARRTPPLNRLQLRYYDDFTKNEQIQKVIEYIKCNFMKEITISEAAGLANFSPTYFSRLFKKETGRSFVEFVTFIRLQRAIWMLRHTNHTIEQISDDLGFNTPNYFSSIFKKYAGLAPSDYRATKEILFH
ncbi:helix-turn-helix domain-containing protein [Peribacillus acanthi]|uniref:helix-turn-helix domain-containing protein n=1 Tax=Peribacillus acanthi TaxID=2171554 RepID=UPI001475BB43|nr:helix-turn-helix domain-containing protein [Peribacillus acanthi]